MNSNLQDNIYYNLRKRIIDIKLVPGEQISVYDISKEMCVSRTPVREAFIRLAGESLLEIRPQRKSRVSLIDLDRVDQECFFRVGLEHAIYALFIKVCEEKHINALKIIEDRLTEHIDRGDIAGALELDDAFHRVPFIVTKQMLSWNEITQMNGHYHRMRHLILRFGTLVTKTHEDHLKLIDAFRHKDLEAAQMVLASHCQIPAIQRVFPDYFKPNEDN